MMDGDDGGRGVRRQVEEGGRDEWRAPDRAIWTTTDKFKIPSAD
jgi:hypothetical protein